jgi:hypothetical protein
VTLLLTLALPGSKIDPLWAVAVIAAFAVAWGALMLSSVPWAHSPVRLSHVSTVLSLGIVAALTAMTGGADSPALAYLWFVVVYAAFFYTPRQALAYWLPCGVVHAPPLGPSSRSRRSRRWGGWPRAATSSRWRRACTSRRRERRQDAASDP